MSAGLGRVLAEPPPSGKNPSRWADLGLRVASAAVMLPLALACWWFGNWAWQALIAVTAVALSFEWVGLCRAEPRWRMMAFMVLGLAWAGISPAVLGATRPAVELGAAAVAVWLLSRRLDLAAGVLYGGAALMSLLFLRADPEAGRANVLFLLVVVWASDIGAYAAGRLIGGAKLAPAISPGKTWSGAAGGLIVAMVAGVVVAGTLTSQSLAVAGLLSVISQAGDLLESWLKRHFKVKDSSHLIPGHGGVLDRVDGLLLAAPAAALLALVLGTGAALWQ